MEIFTRHLLYILISDEKTKFVTDNEEIIICEKFTKLLQKELLKDLTTIIGRIEATSKVTKKKYNIPLYINSDVILFRIDDYWINGCNVLDIKNQLIIFAKGKSIVARRNQRTLRKKIKDVEMLKKYKK